MLVVEGYGPKGLVDDVRNSDWEPCIPNGRNFTGIDFKGLLLVSVPDIIFPQKYKATFFEIPRGSGDEFAVDGYQSDQFIEQIQRETAIEVSFGKNAVILSNNLNLYSNAYRLILEKKAIKAPGLFLII